MVHKFLCACGCGGETGTYVHTNNALGIRKGDPKKFIKGHNNRGLRAGETSRWKGDDANYRSLHEWIRKYYPLTGICECCGSGDRKTQLANISGKYLRDLDDYIEMCPGCHKSFDVMPYNERAAA
jgi:hypothetical protein